MAEARKPGFGCCRRPRGQEWQGPGAGAGGSRGLQLRAHGRSGSRSRKEHNCPLLQSQDRPQEGRRLHLVLCLSLGQSLLPGVAGVILGPAGMEPPLPRPQGQGCVPRGGRKENSPCFSFPKKTPTVPVEVGAAGTGAAGCLLHAPRPAPDVTFGKRFHLPLAGPVGRVAPVSDRP